MGIHGFASFVKKNCPGLGKHVEINKEQSDTQYKLVIDGNSFAFFMARYQNWLIGPKYHDLKNSIITNARKIPKNSIFIFDGALPAYKTSTRHSRNQEKVNALEAVFKASIDLSTDLHAKNSAITLLPPFAISCAADTLKNLGFKVIYAVGEADSLLAHYSIKENCPVLSLDSDFLILNIPGYIPLDSIKWESDDDLTLIGRLYKRSELARFLGIEENFLAILAALGGSDYYSFNEMNSLISINSGLGIVQGCKKFRSIIKMLQTFGRMDYSSASRMIGKKCTKNWQDRMNQLLIFADEQYNGKHVIVSPSTEIEERVVCGIIHPKLLEIISLDTCYCNPFFPGHPRNPSNWDMSSMMRYILYSKLGKLKIDEFKRSGSIVQKKMISILNADSRTLNLVKLLEEELLKDISNLGVYDILVKCLRYMILITHEEDPSDLLGNHEIASAIISAVISVENIPMDIHAQPSANTIRFYGSFEATLFCFSLLSSIPHTNSSSTTHNGNASTLDTESVRSDSDYVPIYYLLDGTVFYTISERIRRGAVFKDFFKLPHSKCVNLALDIYNRTLVDLESFVEETVSLNNNG